MIDYPRMTILLMNEVITTLKRGHNVSEDEINQLRRRLRRDQRLLVDLIMKGRPCTGMARFQLLEAIEIAAKCKNVAATIAESEWWIDADDNDAKTAFAISLERKTRTEWRKHGKDSSGRQRWLNTTTGLTRVDSSVSSFSARIQSRVADCKQRLEAGDSLRRAARLAGITVVTARKYLGDFQRSLRCKCGLESGHRGWCSYRFKQSPKRQLIIARLHRNRDQSINSAMPD